MAQADNFMWDPDHAIIGETTDDFFAPLDAFEIQSWSFNVNNGKDAESDGGGGGAKPDTAVKGAPAVGVIAGKLKFGGVTIVKVVDHTSSQLYEVCCKEFPIPSLILATRRSGGDPFIYLQYMFREVYITQIQWDGGSGTERAKETLTLNCKALGLHYVCMGPDGKEYAPREWCWNVKTLTKTGKGTPNMNVLDGTRVYPYAPTTPPPRPKLR
jgi:type VI protein secretion system component Hcp